MGEFGGGEPGEEFGPDSGAGGAEDAFADKAGEFVALAGAGGAAGVLLPTADGGEAGDALGALAQFFEVGGDGAGAVEAAQGLEAVAGAFEEVVEIGSAGGGAVMSQKGGGKKADAKDGGSFRFGVGRVFGRQWDAGGEGKRVQAGADPLTKRLLRGMGHEVGRGLVDERLAGSGSGGFAKVVAGGRGESGDGFEAAAGAAGAEASVHEGAKSEDEEREVFDGGAEQGEAEGELGAGGQGAGGWGGGPSGGRRGERRVGRGGSEGAKNEGAGRVLVFAEAAGGGRRRGGEDGAIGAGGAAGVGVKRAALRGGAGGEADLTAEHHAEGAAQHRALGSLGQVERFEGAERKAEAKDGEMVQGL